jgi:hypothetical protein
MQLIDLELDSDNELSFMVKVEGTRPGESSCRLMIEGPEMSYTFPGTVDTQGEVTVSIPPMDKILKEGTYKTDLEVIVDDRIFKPLSLSVNFEKAVTVTAEAVIPKKRAPRVTASASLLSSPVRKVEKSRVIHNESRKEADTIPKPAPQQKAPPERTTAKRSSKRSVSLSELNENELRKIIRDAFTTREKK